MKKPEAKRCGGILAASALILSLVFCLVCTIAQVNGAFAEPTEDGLVRSLVLSRDYTGLKKMGAGVMDELAALYQTSSEQERVMIANAFYQLGWKSSSAKQALMRDVHTDKRYLRVSVQYALGRVSNDDDVVDVLLKNMQEDENPYFRDKAACALAYDQPHLTEAQKVELYRGFIGALSDPKPQVRAIAIKALSIHTGQTKGFDPNGLAEDREYIKKEWENWLKEYESNS